MLYAFLLAVGLSLAEFFSEHIAERIKQIHADIVSLNAGIMLSFLFLLFLPELFSFQSTLNKLVFFFLFFGIIAFQLGEKFVYRHSKDSQELRQELALVHLAGFYITGMVEGMALFFSRNFLGEVAGTLLFVPLLLNSVNASVYGTRISNSLPKKEWMLSIAATGPLLGFLLAFALPTESITAQLVFAFVSGALLFTVFRDVMPSEKKVNTELLLVGILVSLLALQTAGLLF